MFKNSIVIIAIAITTVQVNGAPSTRGGSFFEEQEEQLVAQEGLVQDGLAAQEELFPQVPPNTRLNTPRTYDLPVPVIQEGRFRGLTERQAVGILAAELWLQREHARRTAGERRQRDEESGPVTPFFSTEPVERRLDFAQ